jgi:amino acid transporter
MVLIISLLTYFDVRISSMVLAIGLISEVVILLIFDVFLFARGHVTAAPLNPVNAFKSFPAEGKLVAGAIGIGLFFAFWSWVGFEMAPNYGEESRDPKRIVPRALYISVIGLGVFYTITSWASLAGYPTTKAAITTWCAISVGACWPGGLSCWVYRSAARSETSPAIARKVSSKSSRRPR